MNVSMMTKQSDGRLLGWMALAVLTVIGALATPDAHAVLPGVAPPTGVAATSTDWLVWFRAYFQQGTIIAALLLGAVGLIMVVSKVISQYSEVGNGRATWGDVATSAVGGAIVMGISAAVLTLAITVFTP